MTKKTTTPAEQGTLFSDVKGQRVTYDSAGKKTRDSRTTDGISNFMAALGTNSDNLMTASTYSFNFITKNRILLESMYRTSWVIGATVDVPADDMTQGGIDIHSTMDQDDRDQLLEALEDLEIWQSLCSTIKWSRLYGTGMGLLLVDGQDMNTPLRIDTVGIGQFKGILPMDRWQLNPSTGKTIQSLSPRMGMPEYYTSNSDCILPSLGRIHHSRFVRLDAIELPHFQKQTEQLWAESVIERIYDRLLAFDSTTVGAAQLVLKAYLRTWKIKDLRNLIAAGGKSYEAVLKNVEMVRRLQSSEGITMIDNEDEFDTHEYSFSGLDDVLLQFGQQLSGAIEIPLVRLFGQSPAGLNSSGESDLRTYYDGIRKKQRTVLRKPVKKILELTHRSTFGLPLPDGFAYDFRPLWQLSDLEKADIGSKDADSVSKLYGDTIIDKATALRELRQQSHISGRFTNITDEMIIEAENEPPPVPGEGMEGQQPPQGGNGPLVEDDDREPSS